MTANRSKAVALLTYLAVNGSKQTRDSLSALFWPDYDQSKAFTNLRHTLWEIQRAIGEGWLITDRETIAVNPNADIHAARLIGWADTMRVKINDPRPNIEQADVDKIIAACCAKMGEMAFSDMYDEGQQLTLDEALAFAFEES